MGRSEQSTPLRAWPTKPTPTTAAMAAAGLAAWHGAVVLTASGVGIGDVPVTMGALRTGHPLSGLTGAVPASTATTLVGFAVLAVGMFAVVVACAFGWGSWRARHRHGLGFAGRGQVREGRGAGRARASAAQTRPGLSPAQRKPAALHEIGLHLGVATNGAEVVLSLEDHLVVVATTGAGKTRDVMGSAAVAAPGA